MKNHTDRGYRIQLSDDNKWLFTIGVDNFIHKIDIKSRTIVSKYKDFYTFDYDSAFALDPINLYFIGVVSKNGKHVKKRVSKKGRIYLFHCPHSFQSQTTALAFKTKLAFFGSNIGTINVLSVNTHKQLFYFKLKLDNSRVNYMAVDKTEKFLFFSTVYVQGRHFWFWRWLVNSFICW